MFEAKLTECHIFKKIIEAIKDLVTDVNIDVSPSGKYSFLSSMLSLTFYYSEISSQFNFFYFQINLFSHNVLFLLNISFKFRPLSTSNGHITCCPCLPQSKHGRI